ncbi:Putative Lon protease homolog [Candidatus Erwinia haradaeae]|uniref:endopeptidase La n=1 Tax=Candidatus Erwinia haradaeae TaxID=1922217 RepID=A0A451D8I8_9GAMM|nr:Putative Lon protease homolog [Candidatus Erwinia haradaeae]
MTLHNYLLNWKSLQPDTEHFEHLAMKKIVINSDVFCTVQARLYNGLSLFLKTKAQVPLIRIKSPDNSAYLTFFKKMLISIINQKKTKPSRFYEEYYEKVNNWPGGEATPSQNTHIVNDERIYQAGWIENEALFGCVRIHHSEISLSPGLVHQSNGGVLILSLRTLLEQPFMWRRLKKILVNQRYEWNTLDHTRSLPVEIPSIPMHFRLILVGEEDALAEFEHIDPELTYASLYSEFENNIYLSDDIAFINWKRWVQKIADSLTCPVLSPDFWPILIQEAVRWTGDHKILPLNLEWIRYQLQESELYCQDAIIKGEDLTNALNTRLWREGFLLEKMLHDIVHNQIHIETDGEKIGQINALSVIECPGHPRIFGEPTRISCIVHFGDRGLTDVERQVELAGNLHAKGIMILESWLMTELKLDHTMPFSSSLVFEQSYEEIDGDSASLASLCALISALALKPINQKIAVTGSIDQLGQVQSIGKVNEKIEGFFRLCRKRTLNGTQGVIIPSSNIQNLSLHQEVINAVRNGKFSIWSVSTIDEALILLTGIEWKKNGKPCLLRSIQDRITKSSQYNTREYMSLLRWFKWLK